MAQGNFWRSFYQGWDAGDRMYERNRQAAIQRDVGNAGRVEQTSNEEFSSEQVKAIEEAYASGNPEAAPKFENGQYTMADGSVLAPSQTRYTLGNQSQTAQYSPEDVKNARLMAMADVYTRYGDPEKAFSLQEMADNAKMRGYQLNKEKIEAEYQKEWKEFSKNQSEIMSGHALAVKKFQDGLASGDPESAAKSFVQWYNKNVPDGNQVFIGPDGHLALATEDGKISQSNLNVYNPEVQRMMVKASEEAVQSHINRIMPVRDFNQYQAMRSYNDGRKDRAEDVAFRTDRARADDSKTDRQFDFMGRQLDTNIDQFNRKMQQDADQFGVTSGLQRDQLNMQRQHYANSDANDLMRARAAGAAYNRINIVGQTKEGMPLLQDGLGNFYVTGPDGKPNQVNATGLQGARFNKAPKPEMTDKQIERIDGMVTEALSGNSNYKKLGPEEKIAARQEMFDKVVAQMSGDSRVDPMASMDTAAAEIQKTLGAGGGKQAQAKKVQKPLQPAPAPAAKPNMGLQRRPEMLPSMAPTGVSRDWFERGSRGSNIGGALPWAQNDVMNPAPGGIQNLPIQARPLMAPSDLDYFVR